MFSIPSRKQPSFSRRAVRSPPRMRMACSVEKRSWPAGTGVWVVKTHLLPHLLDVGFGGRAQRSAAQLALQQRQRQQRRVALVHVVDVYAVAERVGHAHAAHAQHDLLLQAVVGVAAVQVIGQAAIPARVAFQIGVQQIDRHHVAVAAHQVIAPTAHRHHAIFH